MTSNAYTAVQAGAFSSEILALPCQNSGISGLLLCEPRYAWRHTATTVCCNENSTCIPQKGVNRSTTNGKTTDERRPLACIRDPLRCRLFAPPDSCGISGLGLALKQAPRTPLVDADSISTKSACIHVHDVESRE